MKICLGQRVEKSDNNKFGWNDNISIGEVDSSKPLVICFTGSGATSSYFANGMCKCAENMLGIGDLSSKEKPCNLYGIYYLDSGLGIRDSKITEFFNTTARGEKTDFLQLNNAEQDLVNGICKFTQELVEKLFKPLVQDKNGQIYEPKEIAKSFRNIHFLSFCFGSVVQSAMNQELRKYLESTGLEIETIEKLESQICVLQAAPITEETKTAETTLHFVSLCDEETYQYPIQAKATDDYYEQPNQSLIGGVFHSPNNNPTVFVDQFTNIQGDEEHNSEFYLHFFEEWDGIQRSEKVGGMLSLCTAIALRRAIQNAVSNADSNKFIPLKTGDLAKPCVKYMEWANENPQDIAEALLDIYNKHVDYKHTNLIETLER